MKEESPQSPSTFVRRGPASNPPTDSWIYREIGMESVKRTVNRHPRIFHRTEENRFAAGMLIANSVWESVCQARLLHFFGCLLINECTIKLREILHIGRGKWLIRYYFKQGENCQKHHGHLNFNWRAGVIAEVCTVQMKALVVPRTRYRYLILSSTGMFRYSTGPARWHVHNRKTADRWFVQIKPLVSASNFLAKCKSYVIMQYVTSNALGLKLNPVETCTIITVFKLFI